MTIQRSVNDLGGTNVRITTTNEENFAIDIAMVKIISRHVDAGNDLSEAECEFAEWGLWKMLKNGGIEAVEKYANEYRAEKPRPCRGE